MIKPHGGKLINRIADDESRNKLKEKAQNLKKIALNERETSDLEMIATGALSPLEGFMTSKDYKSVLEERHLSTGPVWTIPVVLSEKEGDDVEIGSEIALCQNGNILAVMEVEDKFTFDKEKEAQAVLRTTDKAHPGVQYLDSISNTYIGGKITLIEKPHYDDFNEFRLDPADTRKLFEEKGWKTITAFQTRNPIHRAHEYLQKCALEIVDALLIHPLMGATKGDDIPGDVRWQCYTTLLENYYPKDRVAISIFPAAMRYAGPSEAIFHAIARKNYGCTHFIVGRDHAGVGNYYGTYDAQLIFNEFDPKEIEITPLFFEHAFYCKVCGNMASTKTCPHSKEHHVFLSGTKVREMLRAGQKPPAEFTRPEVAEVLIRSMKNS
ncbi:MAG: sulfate adenylyltransferase [Candidatus Schekmanbacteria bacterium]|nr:MAG: sulfate adenylyltransferase [Candidatus Schekmanbacteria bacterium]